jgi:hypothetical protein
LGPRSEHWESARKFNVTKVIRKAPGHLRAQIQASQRIKMHGMPMMCDRVFDLLTFTMPQ